MAESVRLYDGGSQQWEFKVGRRADIVTAANAQPYDVDIEHKGRSDPPSAYSRVPEFTTFYSGAKTVQKTTPITFTPTGLNGQIRVTVTNNSGGLTTVRTRVEEPASPEVYREDGKEMLDAGDVRLTEAGGASIIRYDADQSRTEIVSPTGNTVYIPNANSGEIPSSGGGSSIVHTTDTSTADPEKIIVAQTASDIQPAIDALDGNQSGQNGGVVMLLPRRYQPSSPITLKRSVHLMGWQRNYLRSGFGGQGNNKYSVIDDTNLSDGETLITTPVQSGSRSDPADTASVQYLWLDGGSTTNTKGILYDNVNSGVVNRCTITGFENHGIHYIGCFDSTVRATDIEAGVIAESGAGIRLESDSNLSRDCQVAVSGAIGSNYRAIWNSSSVLRIFGEGWRTKLRAANGSPTSGDKGAGLYHDTKGVAWLSDVQVEAKGTANYAGVWTNQQLRWVGGNITQYDWGLFVAGGGRLSEVADVWMDNQATNGIHVQGAGTMPRLNGVAIQNPGAEAIVIDGNMGQRHTNLFIENPTNEAFAQNNDNTALRISDYSQSSVGTLHTGQGTVILDGVEHLPDVSDTNTHPLNAQTPVDGLAQVRDTTNGQRAMFHLFDGGVSVLSDPNSNFGTSSGSGNNHDLVWTGSQHQIENQTGGTVAYEVAYGGDPL